MIQHTLIAANTFDQFNPLIIGQEAGKPPVTFTTPADFINRVLVFAFPIAGLILFVMIIWGGFEMLLGATSTKGKEAGKQRITAAVIGFFLLFLAYWIMRVVGLIFGVAIFN